MALKSVDEELQDPRGFGKGLSIASCAFFSSLPRLWCPQVFVGRAYCAYTENGSQSPGRSSLTTRPGSQAGSLRLAGCCEGGCVSGLSAGHSACWFWGRRSSQSKQAAAPPWALDRLLGLMRSCLVARPERHACTGKCGEGSACSVGVQGGRRLGVPQGWPAPSLPTLYLAIPVFQGSAHLLGGSPFPST